MGHQLSKKPHHPHLFMEQTINGGKEMYTEEPAGDPTLDIQHHPERIAGPSLDMPASEASNNGRSKSTPPHPTDVWRCPNPDGEWQLQAFNPKVRLSAGIYYANYRKRIQAIAIVRHLTDVPMTHYLVRFPNEEAVRLVQVTEINKAVDDPSARQFAQQNAKAFPCMQQGLLCPKKSLQ